MLISSMLEVVICLTFLYLLLSLLMTSVTEWLEQALRARGRFLLKGIRELLTGTNPSDGSQNALHSLYSHPLIHSLYRGTAENALATQRSLPSYIPSRSFSLAVIDLVASGKLSAVTLPHPTSLPAGAPMVDRLRLAAERIGDEKLRTMIIQAVELGAGDLERTRLHIEQWYDSAMERVTGWYRRHTRIYLFVIGLLVSLLLNVNTLIVANTLTKDGALRQSIVVLAEANVANTTADPGSDPTKIGLEK